LKVVSVFVHVFVTLASLAVMVKNSIATLRGYVGTVCRLTSGLPNELLLLSWRGRPVVENCWSLVG
jgi:hypothetical protein